MPDLHGRVWKFETGALTSAKKILFADVRAAAPSGGDQPIGTQLALGQFATSATDPTKAAYVFGVTGNDTRSDELTTSPFIAFAYRDDNTCTSATPGGCATTPEKGVKLFTKDLCEQPNCVQPFRGTLQPTAGISFALDPTKTNGVGRVFFGGTRLVPPPPAPGSTPSGVSGVCRSRFDSIIFALGAESGLAAYDLNVSGSDEYSLSTDSKIMGLSIIGSPAGAQLHVDEGLAPLAPCAKPPDAGKSAFTPATTAVTSVNAMGVMRPGSSLCR